jgi:D-alanyl-D-alanine dipeptidase
MIILSPLICICLILTFMSFALTPLEGKTTFASIRDVLIIENKEPLIDLRKQEIIAYDPAFLQENSDCTKIRQTVYKKLCEAQKLLPCGLRFQMNVGLRSLKVQARMFDEMRKEMQKKFPQMNEKELFLETSKFVAPVKSWEGNPNVPPHSTGGAIDLILIKNDGSSIDLGINLDDLYNEDFIRTDSTCISLKARENRNIMAKALLEVGFVNYPAEFWHWSYGDRRWAFVTGASHSFYGPVTESCIEQQ